MEILSLSVYGTFLYWDVEIRLLYVILSIIGISPALIICFKTENIEKYYDYINYCVFFVRWRFYFKLKNKSNSIFVATYDYLFSRYREYYRRLKRIICFYNLALDMEYEDEKKFGEYSLECLCAYIKDMRKHNEDISGMIAPLIICHAYREKLIQKRLKMWTLIWKKQFLRIANRREKSVN